MYNITVPGPEVDPVNSLEIQIHPHFYINTILNNVHIIDKVIRMRMIEHKSFSTNISFTTRANCCVYSS